MRALVLSGGGVKGAYQVGVLSGLLGGLKTKYDIFCGVSVGAINSAFLAQFKTGEEMEAFDALHKLWLNVENKKIKKSWFLFGKLAALWKPSVYNSAPLQKWINDELDCTRVRDSGKLLRVVAVSWDSGECHVASEGEDFLSSWVAASSAFPVMLTPVQLHGECWADGGLRQVTPLGEAIRAGATEIDVILCDNSDTIQRFQSKEKSSIPSLLVRSIEILVNQVQRADLKICGLKNDIAEANGKYKTVKVRVFAPSDNLVEDSLDFDPGAIRRMIDVGQQDFAKFVG